MSRLLQSNLILFGLGRGKNLPLIEIPLFVSPLLTLVYHLGRSNPVNNGSAVLPASKTPILDATAFCAELKIGAERDADPESIRITDFNTFISQLKVYCPKQHQTQNDEARIKALRRWFDGIPNKKKRKESFVIKMKAEKKNKILVCFKKIQKFVREQGTSPRGESNVPATQMHFAQQALVSYS